MSQWASQRPVETYYVKTTENNYKKLWNGNYRYKFTGYNEEGNGQEIVKVIDRELRPNAFLKIDATGSYGKGWIEVVEEEIPKEALFQLN